MARGRKQRTAAVGFCFGRLCVLDLVRSGASLRLGATHPVVNDRQFRAWRAWAVRAWPTIALVDARGYVVGVQAGEPTVAQLAPVEAVPDGKWRAPIELVRKVLHDQGAGGWWSDLGEPDRPYTHVSVSWGERAVFLGRGQGTRSNTTRRRARPKISVVPCAPRTRMEAFISDMRT